MGFFEELKKSFKERVEGDKELQKSIKELEKSSKEGTIKKTRESVDEIAKKSKEKLKVVSKEFGSKMGGGTERVKETFGKVSETVQKRFDQMADDERVKAGIDKSKQVFEKGKERIGKTGEKLENLRSSAEKSEFVKRTQKISESVEQKFTDVVKKMPLVEETEGEKGNKALVLKTDKVQNAVQERLAVVSKKLQDTRAYKTAAKIKKKIVESENPIIQRTLEMGETVSYNLGRMSNKVFGESDTGKVISLIKELQPSFTQEHFVEHVRDHIVPEVRQALLTPNMEVLKKNLNETALEHLLPVDPEFADASASGVTSESLLLEVHHAEFLEAGLIEDVPTVAIVVSTEETHCVKDSSGNIVRGSEGDLRDVDIALQFQLDQAGQW
eukprot:CAMPEP_0174270970 /NCGR_PEP_ID=MMETSP0439-20130205/46354_1 /TAXON_ID=0 /ORGANISM="Stereomyxa ramosa, Strain Chinc5" /LENGTH=384 /DNA_ID=CAMNT_0015360669 /DNA_START=205 /DNA_END=1356 /DNA_ORIENTATION=-